MAKKGKKKEGKKKAEVNRKKVFDAANKLFVESGFTGASMSEIAKVAGVNKSLIYHHYSSKEDLWEEVLFRHTDRFLQKQVEVFNDHRNYSKDLFKEIISVTFSYFSENPDSARIFQWANLEKSSLEARGRSAAGHWIYMQAMVENVKRAQRKGSLRDDVSPMHMALFLLGIFDYWFMIKDSLPELKLVRSDEDLDNGNYTESLIKLFFEGSKPQS